MIWYSVAISESENKGVILKFQYTGTKTGIYCAASAAVSMSLYLQSNKEEYECLDMVGTCVQIL